MIFIKVGIRTFVYKIIWFPLEDSFNHDDMCDISTKISKTHSFCFARFISLYLIKDFLLLRPVTVKNYQKKNSGTAQDY